MCHANNEMGKKINNGRNITTKPEKNHQARRKGKLQVLRTNGSGHHQTSRDKRKKTKQNIISDEREKFSKPSSAAGISSKI